jgi:hypothetical protein
MKIIQECRDFYLHDWKTNRILFFIESFGTIFSFLAAGILAILSDAAPLGIVFGIFLLANFLCMIAAYKRRSSPMIILNLGFLVINITGLLNSTGVI